MTAKHETEAADLRGAWDQLDQSRQAVRQASINLEDALRIARTHGMTLQAIGDVLGLSRQRVKQLLDRNDSPPTTNLTVGE